MNARRAFLRGCALFGTSLLLRPFDVVGRALPVLPGAAAAPGGALAHAAFIRELGSVFHGPQGVRFVLAKVGEKICCPMTESFSLWFVSASGVLPEQGSHNFAHEQMGAFEMFVVPKAGANGEPGIEAVFNRLV